MWSPSGVRKLLVALALLALTVQALGLRYVVDDAYISFRYARNLVDGHGLTYNPGEPRVEGYTNFLWTLLLALALALGLDPVPVALSLGLLSGLAALLLLERLGREATGEGWSGFAALLLALNPGFATWTSGGLETAFFTAWVLAAAWAMLDEHAPRHLAGLALALACLTRPEGLLAAALLGLGRFAAEGRASLPRTRAALFWVAAAVLPHTAWRLAYYGALLPNTFHAKTGDLAAQLRMGAEYLQRGAAGFAAGPLFLAVLALAWTSRSGAARLAVVFLAGWCSYVLAVGGDGLPMFRFLVPALPFLALVLTLALRRLSGESRAAAVVAGTAALGLTFAAGLSGPDRRYLDFDRLDFVPRVVRVGRALRGLVGPEARIALLPAGAIPYLSGLRAVDMLALNDPVVARKKMRFEQGLAGHSKFDADSVLGHRPDYILMGNVSVTDAPARGHIPPAFLAEAALFEKAQFLAGYELVSFALPGGGWLNTYRRRGAPPSPVAPRLALP